MAVPLVVAPHGGDVDAVAREYGIARSDLVDFSASINPFGPPTGVLERLRREAADPALLARYPDPKYSELRSALASWLRVSPECLSIANGSAAVLNGVIRAIAPKACVLPVPAFGEQPRALGAVGCQIEAFPLPVENGFRLDIAALCRVFDQCPGSLCLLTNPHNPSGTLTASKDMLHVLRAARSSGVQVVIDEAFIDFAPDATLAVEAAQLDHVVVLRSLTKFFGIPALRVGYAISTPAVARRIESQLPAWSVTTLAASAAVAALADEDYARRTLAAVAEDRQRFRERLAACAVEVYESAANFLLLRLPDRGPDSTQLRTRLIRQHGLIVRDCRSFDGMEDGRFIRVAVRTNAENERLAAALRSALEETVIAG